jgi:hypothetical protein
VGITLAQSTTGPGLGLPIGGFITVALLIVTALLIRNMAGRLNRLPTSFEPTPTTMPPASVTGEVATLPEPPETHP